MNTQRFMQWGIVVLTQALIPCLALADFSGRDISVVDSQTIRVLNGKRLVTVRLYGVDCPAKKQPYGKQAKKALRGLVFGKVVTIQPKSLARKGPILGIVLTPDGREVNRELVLAGWCWADEDYATDYVKEMQEAREARRGLWQDPNPTRPEDWRGAHRRRLKPEDFPRLPHSEGEPPLEP
jgi:micrococcal nuclease